jgi:hypothetical protein
MESIRIVRYLFVDVRLQVTCFHRGRRFFQKKIPCLMGGSISNDLDINDSIVQNIPVHDMPSVYVHLELNAKDDESSMLSTSILLGKHTYHESEWQKLLEQPRQTHIDWYPFLG